MRQYTNEEQTVALIKAGFNYPTHDKSRYDVYFKTYTIGDLIGILEQKRHITIRCSNTQRPYSVMVVDNATKKKCSGVHYAELVDALYAMILQIKEEETNDRTADK